MIGKYQIQLGSDQIITGMSSSDYTTDGALGTSSTGMNPFATPGVMRALAGGVDFSTNLSGQIIASCEDFNTTSPNNRYMVDDASGSAHYYSDNGTAITKLKTGSATFIAGLTDMIPFNGFYYISNQTVMVQWDGTNGAGLNESYVTFTTGTASHPMLVYINSLYYGDGPLLKQMPTGGVGSITTIQTFPTNENIVAIGIDPGTGLLLISVHTVTDGSDTIPSRNYVYLHDGISATFRRKIPVDDLVTAFYSLEGQVYVGAGQTLGLWNGSGVTFLRKLMNVTLDNNFLPYKHHFTNIRNILMVVDGGSVLSYGAVVSGKKAFFYTAQNPNGTARIYSVYPRGSNRLAVATATNKEYSFDFSDVTNAGACSMYFNNTYFPRPVYIRRIRIITTAITTGSVGGITFFDEKEHQYNTQVVQMVVASVNSPRYEFDFDYSDAKLQGIQTRINIDTQQFGVIRVIIYYDIAE